MAQKIKNLDNEFTQSQNKKKKTVNKTRQVVRKRLTLFGGVLLFIILVMVIMLVLQKNRNDELVQERKDKAVTYEKLQDKEIELKEQIKRLNDKEYIEKLARSEYFLSNDGEIIFKLPDEKKQSEKDK
ncbi:FtsB family cell division protein [Mammaliicoccus fleurettii]|uniref:Septum formation initiator family protein n=1 Tax=Mammaliicoccus fleurettii TaxID=150056 RepID=A0ABS5MQ64_9STAP|nr:septum formation initiator family protein [Mammaliicoccus fleurettii]HCN61578.1 cell division protein DivIC [Staphylococcus sp.]MBL0848151.1 septum formation initiator family protein [Mammaliicoccus fleurettii]MBS3672939.1 septum formation initiator family protein [Mammaliicoccus fleurettii]MBS3698022.1 septum formation initiator family protein [Mammaliicoccus fleurettii]MEB6202121.1 septum formation initiator family protein [Mammaliicoccus fleurettii]